MDKRSENNNIKINLHMLNNGDQSDFENVVYKRENSSPRIKNDNCETYNPLKRPQKTPSKLLR